MEESSPQLHDSLDLPALRNEIAVLNERNANRRKQTRYVYWGLSVSVGLVVFGVIGANVSLNLALNTLVLAKLAIIGCVLIYFGTRTLYAYQFHRAFSRRFNTYAPDFVPRTTIWDTIRVVGANSFSAFLVLLEIFLPSAYLLPILIVLVIWLISVNGYRRFLIWSYQGGLKRLNQMRRILPGNFFLAGNRAVFLMNSGQLNEAAQIYQELLRRSNRRDIYTIPLWMNNLGVCYTLLEQYPAGFLMLETAIRISPAIGYAYDSLGAWYLEQGLDPNRAVELTEIALELTNPQDIGSMMIRQATSARALALIGRDTRAEALIEQSQQSTAKLDKPIYAEINRQIGHARLAQNNREAALEHFKKAIELDPDGIYGKLAQRALDSV